MSFSTHSAKQQGFPSKGWTRIGMAAGVHGSGLRSALAERPRHGRRPGPRTALHAADLRYVLGHGRLANSSCRLRAAHPLRVRKIGGDTQIASFRRRGNRRSPGVERSAGKFRERIDSTIHWSGGGSRTRRERVRMPCCRCSKYAHRGRDSRSADGTRAQQLGEIALDDTVISRPHGEPQTSLQRVWRSKRSPGSLSRCSRW